MNVPIAKFEGRDRKTCRLTRFCVAGWTPSGTSIKLHGDVNAVFENHLSDLESIVAASDFLGDGWNICD